MSAETPLMPRRSKLIPAGLILVGAAFVLPGFVSQAARAVPGYTLSLSPMIVGDALRAGFWIGLGILLIGWLRNRRWKAEAARLGSGS